MMEGCSTSEVHEGDWAALRETGGHCLRCRILQKKKRTEENVMRMLALRETAPSTRRPKRRLWGSGVSNSDCCGPGCEGLNPRVILPLWLEADSLRNCTARYCTLQPAPRSTIAAAFAFDGSVLASTHGDHTVKILNCRSGLCEQILTGHRRTPWVVRFHPSKANVVASGSLDHEVRLWDASTADCITSHDFYRPIASLAFHASGDLLAVASGHKLYMWQYTKEGEAWQPSIVLRTRRSLRAVHFHPHGAPLLLTAEVNDLDAADTPPTMASSQGYQHYPPPTIHFTTSGAAAAAAALAATGASSFGATPPPVASPYANWLWPGLANGTAEVASASNLEAAAELLRAARRGAAPPTPHDGSLSPLSVNAAAAAVDGQVAPMDLSPRPRPEPFQLAALDAPLRPQPQRPGAAADAGPSRPPLSMFNQLLEAHDPYAAGTSGAAGTAAATLAAFAPQGHRTGGAGAAAAYPGLDLGLSLGLTNSAATPAADNHEEAQPMDTREAPEAAPHHDGAAAAAAAAAAAEAGHALAADAGRRSPTVVGARWDAGGPVADPAPPPPPALPTAAAAAALVGTSMSSLMAHMPPPPPTLVLPPAATHHARGASAAAGPSSSADAAGGTGGSSSSLEESMVEQLQQMLPMGSYTGSGWELPFLQGWVRGHVQAGLRSDPSLSPSPALHAPPAAPAPAPAAPATAPPAPPTPFPPPLVPFPLPPYAPPAAPPGGLGAAGGNEQFPPYQPSEQYQSAVTAARTFANVAMAAAVAAARAAAQAGAGIVGAAGAGLGAGIGAQIGAAAAAGSAGMRYNNTAAAAAAAIAAAGAAVAAGAPGEVPAAATGGVVPETMAAAQAALAATTAVELPCTVKLRIWPHNILQAAAQLDPDTCRLTIPHAVLCSEMGAHFSPCGRFLAACVACIVPAAPGAEAGGVEGAPCSTPPAATAAAAATTPAAAAGAGTAAGGGSSASPRQHSVSWQQQVIYELRVYSLEDDTFGQVLASRAVRAAHCLTSIQFSPCSAHILLAYGRRHNSLLRSLVANGSAIIPIYTILEVYRVSDMALVKVLASAEDEVNVACFHPRVGGGLVYGTKEGKLRIIRHNRDPRWQIPQPPHDVHLQVDAVDPLTFGMMTDSDDSF